MKRTLRSLTHFAAITLRGFPTMRFIWRSGEHFGGASWTEWPEDIRLHRAEAVEKYRAELASGRAVLFLRSVSFLPPVERSARVCAQNGVGMIGDMPIYVALDSADVCQARSFSCSTRKKTFPLRSPEFRRTISARRRSALGKSAVRLGRHAPRRLRLVDTPR